MKFCVSMLVALFLSLPGVVDACSCGTRRPVGEALADSAVVALATVTEVEDSFTLWRKLCYLLGLGPSIRDDPDEWAAFYGFRVSLKVHTAWKGTNANARLLVTTGRGGGDCGFPFSEGATYLVYAYTTTSGLFYVHLCSRTTLVDTAQEDVAVLDATHLQL